MYSAKKLLIKLKTGHAIRPTGIHVILTTAKSVYPVDHMKINCIFNSNVGSVQCISARILDAYLDQVVRLRLKQ